MMNLLTIVQRVLETYVIPDSLFGKVKTSLDKPIYDGFCLIFLFLVLLFLNSRVWTGKFLYLNK